MIAVVSVTQLFGAPIAAAATAQTISFDLPASSIVGTELPMDATATSGLVVSFVSNTPTACSVAGFMLTLLAEGTCTVTASQAGDATWDPAPDVQDSMTVDPSPFPRQPQTITFVLLPSGYVGGTMALTGTASSGLGVVYAVQTPSVCATDGTTLALDASGTCTVTASQPGNQEEWLAAPNVTVSTTVKLPPYVTSDGANLGRYALNGGIKSMVIDPDTGVTYIGGSFTQIGVRSGSVALVNPPGSGSDGMKVGGPDVIGSALKTFPDDATGFFLTGQIGSVNGDGIHRDIAARMTMAGTVDGSWAIRTTCGGSGLPNWASFPITWDLGNKLVAGISMSPTTTGDSTTGLVFIDKGTGIARRTGAGNGTCGAGSRLWPSTPVFAPLATCASWAVCNGYVIDMVEDPGSNSLVVAVNVSRGQTVGTQERRQTWLMAYDLTTGARRWATRLESSAPVGLSPNSDWGASVTHLGGLSGSILVSGKFPLEPLLRVNEKVTNALLVDAASGTILQRWDELGEQSVGDPLGDEIAPATSCTPVDDAATSYERWRFIPRSATHAIGYGESFDVGGATTFPVCDYSVTGTGLAARLSASSIGTLAAAPSPDLIQPLPSTLYNGHLLVGPFDAFDLDTGSQVGGWHPSPSSGSVTLSVAGSTIVIVGGATFLKGSPAFHVLALDRDLAPIAGFQSGLLTPDPSEDWFRGLALEGDRIVVVGQLLGPSGASHMIALDKATGAVTWTAPSTPTTFPFSLAVDPATGAAYVGFEGDAGTFLRRYTPNGGGFQLDGSFAPAFVSDGGFPAVTAMAWIGGRLYVGGVFTSIDGQSRQGLARFGADGSLDTWAPQLVDEIGAPAGAEVEAVPNSFLEVGGNVIVAGRFNYVIPAPGGSLIYGPPTVRAYSIADASLVRPLDGKPWYGENGADPGYGMAAIDGVVYVAHGNSGIVAFDATTFDYLPFLSVRTFPGWGSNAVYAIAARTTTGSVTDAGVQTATAATSALVFGGVIPTWHNHTASNVLEVGTGALNSDHTAPTASAITNRPQNGGTAAGSSVPWTIGWIGKDLGGAGVGRYELARSRNGGTWTLVSVNLLKASASVGLTPGSNYRFRVRAIDRAGNVGAWAYGTTFKVTAVQQSSSLVRYRGSWATVTGSTTWWGGSARMSTAKGATATFTFTGRSIAWVSLKAPKRGKAYVYINGSLKATVDLYSAATQKAVVVWSALYSTSATRTITIKVVGTSGRPRVDVDGFLIGR
jgi:hypothetical protein